MNIDMILLEAKLEAFRTYFTSMLSVLFKDDPQKDDRVWLAKYLMWEFERANLSPFDYTDKLSTPEKDRISHRRFQLQVLMDVAYIHGNLEEYGILRIVDSYAASQALQVFSEANKSGAGKSEEAMLPLIDKIYFP